MKETIKKITLYYREMNEWLRDFYEEEVEYDESNIVIFKTEEGGYGIRRQHYNWSEGDTVWTADGKQPARVIAVVPHSALESLLNIFRKATYMVNRFLDEPSRRAYLNGVEKELMTIAG